MRTRQSKLQRRSDSVMAARAGIIFESDDINDEKRSRIDAKARVFQAVEDYAESVTYGSERQAIIDILAEIRHYCDWRGFEFTKLDNAAREFYLEEGDFE